MSTYLILILEFFKIGLFAIGGGYATVPFLYNLSSVHHWFNPKDLIQMLAIANIVPGPVGINLASLTGYRVAGFWGAFAAATGIMIPSLIFVFIISKLLKEFEGNRFVKAILYMLKPASCAMIFAIGFKLLKETIFETGQPVSFHSIEWSALILFLALFIISLKQKYSPLFYLGVPALVGVIIHIIKPFIFG